MKTFMKIVMVISACTAAIIGLCCAINAFSEYMPTKKYISTDAQDEDLPF